MANLRSTLTTSEPIIAATPAAHIVRGLDFGWYGVAALTLAGLVLRALPINATALWYDEAFQAHAASVPWSELLSAISADAGAAPLDFFGTRLTMALVPDPVTGPRLWPLIAGTLSTPAAFLAGRVWFDRTSGLAAAALVATAPFLVYYSTEARYYALGVSLGLLNFWALRARRWLWYGLTAAAGIYTILSFAALLLVGGIYLLCRSEWRGISALMAASALFSPWFFYDTASQIGAHYGFATPSLIASTAYSLVALLGMSSALIVGGALVAIVLGLAAFGLKRQSTAWPLAILIPVIAVMMWFVCWRSGYFWVPRYVILELVPLILLAAAASLGCVAHGGTRWLRHTDCSYRLPCGWSSLATSV